MAETKETLSIKAQFDASQLKGEAQRALSDLGNETKKLQQDFQSTDRVAVQNLKNVENQAKSTAAAVKQIGNEAKATEATLQKINIKQGIGVAAHGAQMVAGAISQSDFGQTQTGSALAGGLAGIASGAMMGATLGSVIPGLGTAVGAGIGAAAGLLMGAGQKLIEAAYAQKKSVEDQKALAQDRYEKFTQLQDAELEARNWGRHLDRYVAGFENEDTVQNLDAEIQKYQDEIKQNAEKQREVRQSIDSQIEQISQSTSLNKDEREKLAKSVYEYGGDQLEELTTEQTKNQQKLVDLLRTRTAVETAIAAKEKLFDDLADEYLAAEKEKVKHAEATAKEEFNANKKSRLDEIKTKLNSESEYLKENESLLSEYNQRSNSFRITDALTKIGGTSGYGAINESVQSSLGKIVDGLKTLIANSYTMISKLENDYKTTAEAVWAGSAY